MIENWKYIPGYEGKYQVSDQGRVRSLNYNKTAGKVKVLSLLKVSGGYLGVYLGHNNLKLVHRLVASAFIPNPHNLPCVNHKSMVRSDNNVNNLEWCDYRYNNNYGDAIEKRVEKQRRAVKQISQNGNIVVWYSIMEAERNGFSHAGIIQCCQGKLKKYKGYKWEYIC